MENENNEGLPQPQKQPEQALGQGEDGKFDFKGFRTFFKKEAEPAPEVPINEQVEALKKQQKIDLAKHMKKHGLIQSTVEDHQQLL